MSKHEKKSKKRLGDIHIKSVPEAVGHISSVTPVAGSMHTHGGDIPLELAGFVAVIPNVSSVYTFLIKISVTPASDGLPVAYSQTALILHSGGYTQFSVLTVHFQPPQGTYHLKATIDAQLTSGGDLVSVDQKEWDYIVV